MRNVARSATTTKIAASVALVAGTAAVAGLGTFGAFTSTTTATQAVGSGKVVMNMSAQAGQGFEVATTNLVPGDTVQRAVTLTREAGSEKFGSVKLTTTAGANATKLVTDETAGLQLSVDQCTTPWTKAANSKVLTCTGAPANVTSVLAKRTVLGQNVDLNGVLAKLNADATPSANLRVTLELPTAADNTFQNLSDTVTFTVDATQRAGEAR
ncbi:TasA family protein [Nocardioides pantholopis]|uniref:TasA family protein n=1 Tax=Nocardioides pantholopis TaxID=2483798 RepID=UPI000F08294C|nr:TasA family protein [Nocardioides pantholopis]